jgi:hypothetical protein
MLVHHCILLPQPAKAPPRVFMLRFKEQSDRDKLFW